MTTQVIVNGGSSSGKTGIARCLQAILPQPWISLGVDDLLDSLPPSLPDSADPGLHHAATVIRWLDSAGGRIKRAAGLLRAQPPKETGRTHETTTQDGGTAMSVLEMHNVSQTYGQDAAACEDAARMGWTRIGDGSVRLPVKSPSATFLRRSR